MSEIRLTCGSSLRWNSSSHCEYQNVKQLHKEYNLFLGSRNESRGVVISLSETTTVQYETLHFMWNTTADVVFILQLQLVFHAWSTSHNLDQTWGRWNLCPENIFLEPTERSQSRPTQPIPGSSIHTSFAASSLLKQSYSYFAHCVHCHSVCRATNNKLASSYLVQMHLGYLLPVTVLILWNTFGDIFTPAKSDLEWCGALEDRSCEMTLGWMLSIY